jgi:hypothetical protein
VVSLGRSCRLFPTLDATNFKLRPCERGMTSERRVGTCHVLCLHVTYFADSGAQPLELELELSTYVAMNNMNCLDHHILQMNHKYKMQGLIWKSDASRKRAHDLKGGSNGYKLPTDSKTTRGTRLAYRALISPSSTIGEAQKSFPKLPSHIMLRLVICSSTIALSVT